MKKTLLAAALMGLGASAFAQSSVTLYGRLDNGIEYQVGARAMPRATPPRQAHASALKAATGAPVCGG
jgi:predicted porin